MLSHSSFQLFQHFLHLFVCFLSTKGHWMDRSEYQHIDAIYKCARATCVGAREVKNASCWASSAFEGAPTSVNDDSSEAATSEAADGEAAADGAGAVCDSDALQCREGSRSIMCGSCEDGYTFSGSANACVACESSVSDASIITIISATIYCASVATARHNRPSSHGAEAFAAFGLNTHMSIHNNKTGYLLSP